jgi:Spherulation-specific family 4
MLHCQYALLWLLGVLVGELSVNAQESPALTLAASSARAQQSRQFHIAASQGTGLLIPMYVYPADIHTNASYNRLMELKRRFERIPFWVILNPSSGPGQQVDANYFKAVDRLIGAGCSVLGYVLTGYGKRSLAEVAKDLQAWQRLYPRTQGIFFDEMVYENDSAQVAHQLKLSHAARELGFWPIVGNPGADTPEPYFAANVADVIVVHEGAEWPQEKQLHGDYFGGHSDYPPWSRGVLVHSMPRVSRQKVAMLCKYARWIYVTEDQFVDRTDNPWDVLSAHLEATCRLIETEED